MPEQFGPCMEDEDVAATINEFLEYKSTFESLDGAEDVARQNYADNKDLVDAWGSQMNPSWDHGLYFQAGQFYGLMTELVFDMPEDF